MLLPAYGTSEDVNGDGILIESVVLFTLDGKKYLAVWNQLSEFDQL
jgi:hypothetical protein